MKKMIIGFLFICFFTSTAQADPPLCGDANLDDTVNVLDVMRVVGGLLGDLDLESDEHRRLDHNCDGALNILDVVQTVSIVLAWVDDGGAPCECAMTAADCDTLDTVVWDWGGISGPCGPQNSVTVHANGQIVESLQGATPEGPNDTCMATQRHFEILGSHNRALIQSVCADYLNNFEPNGDCVGAYSRWTFMDVDDEIAQTGNLSCGNTSMAASAAAYEALMDSLMAPNTCEYGCGTTADCLDGYRCQGAVSAGSEGMGQCIESDVTVAGEGANCGASDGSCGEGLVCIGDLMGEGWNTPTCEPAWMANSFASNPMLSIPNNGFVTDSQVACGLYTVPMGGILYLDITHDNLSQLEVSLDNPDGGYLLSFTPTAEILSEGLVITPPTDESANGTWTLRVEDTVSGTTTGVLNGWALYLESWPD